MSTFLFGTKEEEGEEVHSNKARKVSLMPPLIVLHLVC